MAAIRMSARDVTRARSRVWLWQIVTVAFSLVIMAATGLPTIRLRPTTTTSSPADRDPRGLDELDDPEGRAGPQPGLVLHEEAEAGGVEAVHVLVRAKPGDASCESSGAGRGSWTRIPST